MNRTALLNRLTAQLKEQATPRALVGLGALVLILALWGLSEMGGAVVSLRQSVDEMERAKRLELSLLSDQSWIDHAGDIQAQLDSTQSNFWEGATNGIIAAQLQGSIEGAARNAGLDRVRVNVTATPEPLGQTASLFEVSVSARDTNGQFLAFYQELGRTEDLLVISRFSWRRNTGALDMRILAPARLSSAEAEI